MIAALDDATGVPYTDLQEMHYGDLLRLNLDVRTHSERKREALEEKYDDI